MVAYSYKGRFVAPIRVGLGLPILDLHYELGGYAPGSLIRPKRQTIRANGRRRHARAGETLQLYYAQRSPTKCFKIGEGRCKAVDDIRIYVHAEWIETGGYIRKSARELDAFAVKDGFDDWSGMRAFWLEEHDGKHLGPFVGVLIQWEPLR
ncbi:hypothetical protein [Bradyrhizobium yuanmingense]|uniref:hypothetical protein n=1 Tax=Bradyrhizobium yuanmingense TaxID=108015 RepID=UPI0004B8E2CD|nr:hypothetical protein [Bradyrhizobium yuanmingense]